MALYPESYPTRNVNSVALPFDSSFEKLIYVQQDDYGHGPERAVFYLCNGLIRNALLDGRGVDTQKNLALESWENEGGLINHW